MRGNTSSLPIRLGTVGHWNSISMPVDGPCSVLGHGGRSGWIKVSGPLASAGWPPVSTGQLTPGGHLRGRMVGGAAAHGAGRQSRFQTRCRAEETIRAHNTLTFCLRAHRPHQSRLNERAEVAGG